MGRKNRSRSFDQMRDSFTLDSTTKRKDMSTGLDKGQDTPVSFGDVIEELKVDAEGDSSETLSETAKDVASVDDHVGCHMLDNEQAQEEEGKQGDVEIPAIAINNEAPNQSDEESSSSPEANYSATTSDGAEPEAAADIQSFDHDSDSQSDNLILDEGLTNSIRSSPDYKQGRPSGNDQFNWSLSTLALPSLLKQTYFINILMIWKLI